MPTSYTTSWDLTIREERDLERYFDLAGCHGDERERARALAPHDASAQIGWYVLRKPGS